MRNLFIIIGTILCINAFSATITPSGVLTAGFCKHGYTVQLATTGLTAPVTYSLTAGSLPPGVTLSTSSGLIQGIISTTADASYTFTLSARGTGTVVATSTNTINVTAITDLTLEQMWKYWTGPTYPQKFQVFDTWSTLRTIPGFTGCTGGVSERECAHIIDRTNLYENFNKHFLVNTSTDIVNGSIPYSTIILDSLTAIYQTSGHRAGISSIFQQDTLGTYISSPSGVFLSDTTYTGGGAHFFNDSVRFNSTYKLSSVDGRRNIRFGTNIDINTNQYGNVNVNTTAGGVNALTSYYLSSNNAQANCTVGSKQVQLAAAKDNFSTNVVFTIDTLRGAEVESGDLSVATAGKGLKVKGGANAKQGQASLAGTTVVVNNTSVTANSRILLTEVGAGSLGNVYVEGITPATSFTITAPTTHTTTVNYFIFESQ